MPDDSCIVRPPRPQDFEAWRVLHAGYAEFYERQASATDAERVWSWIHDPAHPVECLLAEDGAGRIVGLAHFREFPRPLMAAVGGFLDDLFVAPAARGTGVADALLAGIRRVGADRGWTVVRWITADDNRPARALYDRLAERTRWVTYDMQVDAP